MKDLMGIILAAGKGSRMQSDLPKVLHQVNGQAMVRRCVDAMEQAGATRIVVVVGYRQELVRDELGDRVEYAVQEEQLGTGHAVMSAKPHLEQHDGRVLIVYGDNPLISANTLRQLAEQSESPQSGGALLTISLENPPAAGRIIRDEAGNFVRIVEEKDCTEEQKKIQEVNVGTYCFRSAPLLEALSKLRSNNAQGEYYLTDVPEHMAASGFPVGTVATDDIFEALGVNDKRHLCFAETAEDIRFAEQLYPLIDATVNMSRTEAH